jgi:glycosyltransferase involved in cell wall biosynthesis
MLEQLIAKLGMHDRVQLVGFDLNPWRWVARANLYVSSSRWEGHPNSLLEALALQRPAVVAAYDESVQEMAREFGLTMVPPGDADAMAGAITDQLARPLPPLLPRWVSSPERAAVDYLNVLQCAPDNAPTTDRKMGGVRDEDLESPG